MILLRILLGEIIELVGQFKTNLFCFYNFKKIQYTNYFICELYIALYETLFQNKTKIKSDAINTVQ